MKTMKKVLAFMLALAMVVTAVPVTNAEAATGLPKSKSYYAGKTYTLKLTTPSSWKSVSTVWSATNNNTKAVAISDKKAKSVTVKALKKGKAVVTAKVTYKKGGVKTTKTYKCNVRVKAPTIAVSPKAVTVDVDKTVDLKTTFVPASGIVTYESEDEQVAAVKATSTGAVVTGVSAGETNIKAYLRCGKKVKMSIVKVTVKGENLADGLSAKITNQFMDYEDTVVANQAFLRFYYGKGGKGVSGKTISYVDGVVTQNAITDANGYAFLAITNPGVKKVNYTATVVATGEKVTGTINFAAIGISNVSVVNGVKDDWSVPYNGVNYIDLGYKNLVVAENDARGATKGDGKTESAGTFTFKNANSVSDLTGTDGTMQLGYKTNFVDSQQVSSLGTDDHKVGFNGGLPYIFLPGKDSDLNAATKFQQGISKTAESYDTYANKTDYITLSIDPNELTYATLNFKNLKLSEYTYMQISCWENEAAAKGSYNQIGSTTKVYGPHEQADFSYQIPLWANKYASLCIKVELISAGQVNTALNKGYDIVDITGVYKNKTDVQWGSTQLLKGATIEWKQTNAVFSEERALDYALTNLGTSVAADFAAAAKVTYRVPVYPYAGNAVITTYDNKNKVLGYYACPAINNGYTYKDANGNTIAARHDARYGFNENVLDTTADYVYKISEEEAFNSVGEISQDGTLVTVNSTKAGTTHLVGKIAGVDGLDATNSEVYTSVQWNPVQNAAGPQNSGAIAFLGQNLEVIAQLVDKNGNAVSAANKKITFSYDSDNNANTSAVNVGAVGSLVNTYGGAGSTATVVSKNEMTDSKGQAKLTLKSYKTGAVIGMTASSTDYNVVIKVGTQEVKAADLYWMNLRTAFVSSAFGTGNAEKTSDNVTVKNGDAGVEGLNPEVGTSWEYGFKVAQETLANAGVWANRRVSISNAKISVSVGAGNVATVNTNTGVNGMVSATSTKAGITKLIGKVDGTAVSGAEIGFTVSNGNWWETVNTTSSGVGPTSIDSKLNLEVKWGLCGQTAEFVSVNGFKTAQVASGNTYTVYLKVTDEYGNPDKNRNVTVTVSGNTEILSAPGVSVGKTWNTKSNNDGVVAVTVIRTATSATNDTTDVIAKVDGIADQIYSATINWMATATALKIDATQEDNSYVTRARDNKIVLTFKNEILASSVVKQQFKVTYGGSEIEVTSVDVVGKQVILTLTHDAARTNVGVPYAVTYAAATVDSVVYTVTDIDGNALTNGNVNVYAKEEAPTGTLI